MPIARSSLWLSLFEQSTGGLGGRREQLVAALRRGIRDGVLAAGDRLPASRQLAEDLGLSRVTVEAAYARLEAEGYVQRHVGRGTFVGDSLPFLRSSPKTIRPVAAKLSRRGQRVVGGGGCFDPPRPLAFAAGSPDLRAFPFALWRQLHHRRVRLQPELFGYGDPQGLLELRVEIAAYLNAARGLSCGPDQVLVLSSSQQALQLAAWMLLDEGDTVWLEEPCYRGAATAFAAAGARLIPVPLDAEGMCPGSDLPSPRLIYLTPSHQYPWGMALSLRRRSTILDHAAQAGAWILEDDYDSEFHYDGKPMPSMQGLDPNGRVLYIGTFSKVLFPSLRLAYLVLPEKLVEAFVAARSIQDGHSSQIPQSVTADFMREGHFATHLRLMRKLYRQRRDVLLECLQRAPGWLQPQPSPGGLQIAVRLPEGAERDLSRAGNALGLQLPSLSSLYMGARKQDGWLLGYSALTPSEIVQACRLVTALR